MVQLPTNLRINPRVSVLNDQLIDRFGVFLPQSFLDGVGSGGGAGGRDAEGVPALFGGEGGGRGGDLFEEGDGAFCRGRRCGGRKRVRNGEEGKGKSRVEGRSKGRGERKRTLVGNELADTVPLLLVLQTFLIGENNGGKGGFEVFLESSSAHKFRRYQY